MNTNYLPLTNNKKANPPDWLFYCLLRSFPLVSTTMLQLSDPEYIQHVPIAVKK